MNSLEYDSLKRGKKVKKYQNLGAPEEPYFIDYSEWCSNQPMPDKRIYDHSLEGIDLQNDRKKCTKNSVISHFEGIYRMGHTMLALQTKHNEIGTIEEIMNLETLYSIEFTGLNINLDNEQRSFQYHRYKDKGAGLVIIHNIPAGLENYDFNR